MKHIKLFALFCLAVLLLEACGSETEPEMDAMEFKNSILPIVGNRDVEYRTVNGKEIVDTVYHVVPNFKYLNHDSIMRTSQEFEGKLRVVDFFFTHCPSICPPMTAHMRQLNMETKDISQHIEFLSFSIDPERDTPSRLIEYRKMNSITAKNWNFFTGNEAATHLLAKDFFNGAERNDQVDGGFGHTPYFVLVDREGYVRGIYNGTLLKEVKKLQADIRKLLREEYKVK